MSRAQALLVGAFVLACGVVGTLTLAFVRQGAVDVYFDNGFADNVTIALADETFPVAKGRHLKRQLAPGSYEVVVSTAEGEVERGDITVEKLPLMTALLHTRFYVYNVARANIYRRAEHVYAEDPSLREYSEQIIAFERFFSQPEAHFVFQPAPDTITTDSKIVRREEFTVAHDMDYNALANVRYAEGNTEEAMRALTKAIELDPCHTGARRNEITLLMFDGRNEEALSKARSWMDACSDSDVDAHRAYQDTMIELGRRNEVLSQYRGRRRRDPSAANHYLLGRLLDGDEALRLYRAAIQQDPTFTRARIALAYEMMGLEQFDGAFDALAASLDDPAHTLEIVYMYALAGIGAERTEEARSKLWNLAGQFPYDPTVWEARWSLSLAREDWAEAGRLHAEYQQKMQDDGWSYQIQLASLRGDLEAALRQIELAAQRPDLAAEASGLRFQNLYAQQKYQEAGSCLDEVEEVAARFYRLYAAAGLLMSSGAPAARPHLRALEESLGTGSHDVFYRNMIGVLEGRASEAEALRAARDANFMMLPHAYFMLGAREQMSGRTRAAQRYFAKSAATSVSFEFPYLPAKRLSEL